MKRKLLIVFLAIVSVVCCALGLAACGDKGDGGNQGGTVKCTLNYPANGVDSITVSLDNAIIISINQDITTLVEKEIEKGKEYLITVNLERGYDFADQYVEIVLKGANQNQPVKLDLTRHEDEDDFELVYGTCTYTPTSDLNFVITSMWATERIWLDYYVGDDGKLTLPVGHTEVFEAGILKGPDHKYDLDATVELVSDNENIAKVQLLTNEESFWKFNITAVSIGTTTITVNVYSYLDLNSHHLYISETFEVSVVEAEHIESFTINKTDITLELGLQEEEYIQLYPSSDTRISVTTDNPSVAIAGDGGYHYVKVRPISAGTAKITITAGDKTAICNVTVKAPPQKVTGSSGLNYSVGTTYLNSYTVSGIGNCTDTKIIIPNYYNDMRVVKIARYAFNGNRAITEVSISDGIYEIDELAFGDCASLEWVYIGNSLKSIGNGAFYSCNSLKGITYSGTIEEWLKIEKDNDNWILQYQTQYIIYCLDGTIAGDGTITRYEQQDGEVTATLWQAALSQSAFNNVTATMTLDGDTYLLKVDLDSYVYYYTDNSPSENFYSMESGAYYNYKKKATDTKFTKKATTQEYFESQLLALEPLAILMFVDSYEEFTYNADTNSYIAESVTIDSYTYGVEFKFLNGKLIYADIDLGDNTHLIIEYSNYGSTTVTLPTDYIDNTSSAQGSEMSVEQLIELAASAEEKNYTKVVRTANGEPETFYYGTGDWNEVVEEAHLTVAKIEKLNVQSITRKDSTYEITYKIDLGSFYLIVIMEVDEDFYAVKVNLKTCANNGAVMQDQTSTYEWDYATADELASVR